MYMGNIVESVDNRRQADTKSRPNMASGPVAKTRAGHSPAVRARKNMMKKIILLIAFVIVFAAGALTATLLHIGSPIVTVDFTNNSTQRIKSIDVNHEIGRFGKVRYLISDLEPKQTRTLRVFAPAESSYEVTVTFADNSRVVGGAGYVEAGYRIRESIGPQKIDSKVDLMGGYKP